MKLKRDLRFAKRFVKTDMWELNLENLSRTKANMVKTLQLISHTILNLDKNNIGMLSASLCYFCMMAVVPLLAVGFALTDGLGLSDTLENILFTNFGTDNQFVNMILTAANNIIDTAKTGIFGIVSALAFVWLIIWMMDRVEKVFNVVWGVPKPQKVRKRYFAYGIDLAILFFAPFVVIVFFAGSVVYSNVLDLVISNKIAFSDSLKSLLSWMIFGVSIVMILSAMYKYVPAVKVKYRHAFKAALIAGISFTVLQYLYLETQVFVMRINAVYGTIAAIPLMLLWLRYGWLIIVIGVQLSASFQNLANTYFAEPKLLKD